MFAVLDTNHFRELVDDTPPGTRLKERLKARKAVAFTTIITSHEVCQGWCALINRQRAGRAQVHAYKQFQHSLDLLGDLVVLAFDDEAADSFDTLHRQRVRIGTMDLKIASICRRTRSDAALAEPRGL